MSRPPRELRKLAHGGLAAWLLASLVVTPPWLPAAQAAPKGEKVVKGKATFTRDGDLTVIRTGKRAIIEYTGFDIGQHETVRFEQPNAKSRVLNRVSGDASRIDGKLQANGIVYIVNPAGVFFGRTAIVDVKRLVAAAGDLPDRKFLKQVDRFSLMGPVENLGAIEASSVALLGTTVANHGSIVAPDGVIALVAGERVVLTRLEGGISVEVDGGPAGAERGVDQRGVVDAAGGAARFAVGDHYSLAINHEGVTRARNIALEGGDGGLVKVAGTLDASAPEAGRKGGSVRVTGELVQLDGALLDASGAAGGGEIRVGGDLRGQGPLRNARRTFVDGDSTLRADALEQGKGGSAVVYGEEAAAFHGEISARGGAAGGDGGFAELSSNGQLVDEGSADLGAPAGQAGTLLYDPQDIEIVGGTPVTGDGSDTPDTSPDELEQEAAGRVLFGNAGEGGAEPFLIYESEIEGTDANIILEARNSIRVASGSTFDHDSGATEGNGVVVIRSGNDFFLRTRNQAAVPASGDDPAIPADSQGSARAPGIDLTGSAHGANLEIRTSGDGNIRFETGSGPELVEEAPIRVGILTTRGGEVAAVTVDGLIEVTRATTSGEAGSDGANAANIILDAGDQNGSGGTHVIAGDLVARGGTGSSGEGGNGGQVGVRTRPATNPLLGGGPVTVGNVDTSGGDGPEGGGNGALVFLETAHTGAVIAGNITTRGGDAIASGTEGSGGNGGPVSAVAASGNVTVGAVDATGGDTDGNETEVVDGETVPSEFGGRGGDVQMNAGTDEDGTGNLTFNGNLDLRGGDNPNPALEDGAGVGAGGTADLRAKGAVEHGGQAGPHVRTQGNVVFNASDVGALAPIVVSGAGTEEGLLGLGADDIARIQVDENTFDDFQVVAFGESSDIQVVEGALGEIIRIQGNDLVRADTSVHHADMTLGIQDRLEGEDDVDGGITFRLRTGSIHAGGNVRILSEDDIILGDSAGTVAVMDTRPLDTPPDPDDPPQPSRSGVLILIADQQSEDLIGGVRDGVAGAATGALNLKGDAEEAGGLYVSSRQGIGAEGDPIGTVHTESADPEDSEAIPIALLTRAPKVGEPSGGIFVRNDGGGDLTTAALFPPGVVEGISGVSVEGGPGNVVLDNTAGDLVIELPVRTTGDTNGNGGAITLRAGPDAADAVTLATRFVPAVDANGDVTFETKVHLDQNSAIVAGGNVDFDSSIDTDPEIGGRVRSLIIGAPEGDDTTPTIRLAGDVGAVNDLRSAAFGGNVVLAGGARSVHVTTAVAFLGTIDADADDSASLAILAGPVVELSGDIGATGRLQGFSVARNEDLPFAGEVPHPVVRFSSAGDQVVDTGAGGISFPALPEIPDTAPVGKVGGGLTLQSTGGDVIFGANQKLTAQGDVVLRGDTVQMGDVNGLTITVDSPDAHILAREPGEVLLAGGGRVRDQGTDLVGNEVTFTNAAPIVDGIGVVRVITPDGTATNAGALEPVAFQRNIAADDMLRSNTVLDLTALQTNLPNEVPQRGPDISGLVPLRRSDATASGSALPPEAEATLAYLRCAAAQPQSECHVVPASPLDSPRGEALAREASALLGDSPEAVARRQALSRLEPGALRELAVFLTEIRLLGLSETEYQAVRDSLYAEILAGTGAPERSTFAKAVQDQSRGVPL